MLRKITAEIDHNSKMTRQLMTDINVIHALINFYLIFIVVGRINPVYNIRFVWPV